jgi:quercetin dioxygenase-like cupin family protein
VAAQALAAVSDQLMWRPSYRNRQGEPDMATFTRNFTANTIIGAGELLPSDKVKAGFSLQAPDTYYPGHLHDAEESYWIIGGRGDWKVATQPWFAVNPGDSVYHQSGVRHTMQTNEHPMLTVWLWTSHLDSEVMMVRG